MNALEFAAIHTEITDEEKKIFLQCRKSYLCYANSLWVKRGNSSFDVTMGSFDGAEICDLVGLYLLSQLQNLGLDIGLYRDDGLAVGFQTPAELEDIKKEICRIFKDNQLSIVTEANSKIINFLDVTLNLNNGVYKPFMKLNDKPVYVNKNSNHPPSVINNITAGINKRLSRISSNEEVFKEKIPPYQDALKESGYDYKLNYEPNQRTTRNSKNRQRNRIFFNPPWSANCKTKVGANFLKLVDTCFPPSNPLHKIFNRNTLKVSYSCLPNMAQVISKHNSKLQNKTSDVPAPGCNCRGGVANCPLDGACLTKGVVYGAKVTKSSDQSTEFYTGLTARKFKERYYEHTASFRHENLRHKTTLSEHIWKLNSQHEPYTVRWRVIDRVKPFNSLTKTSEICPK